jgi:hypothetical protein
MKVKGKGQGRTCTLTPNPFLLKGMVFAAALPSTFPKGEVGNYIGATRPTFETPVPDVVRGSWNRIPVTNYKPAVMGRFPWFDLKGLPFPPDPGADSSRPGEGLSLSFLQTWFGLFLPFFRSDGVGGQFSITVARLLFSCPSHFIFLFPPFCLLFVVLDLLPSVTCWSFVVSEQGHGDVKRYILFRNWVISNEEFRYMRFGSRC